MTQVGPGRVERPPPTHTHTRTHCASARPPSAAAPQYAVDTVPALVLFPPTTSKPHARGTFPPSWRFPLSSSTDNAESVAAFVHERTGAPLDAQWAARSRLETGASFAPALVVIAASLAAIVYFTRSGLVRLLRWARERVRWWLLLGALAFYFVGVSGLLFDVIRGAPLLGTDARTRRPSILIQQAGVQSVAEGLLVGGLNLACAAAVVLLVRVLPRVADYGQRTVLAVAALSAFMLCYSNIVGFYRWKQPAYLR